MAAKHYIGGTHIITSTIYGYPQNATWPQGHQLTNQLLATITKDIIYGSSGVRVVTGDFNCQAGDLAEQQIWLQCGWKESQTLAEELFGQEWQGTTTGTSAVDQIWLSPEAQALCRSFQVRHVFSGHSTISVQLEIPQVELQIQSWPRPANIPWEQLQNTEPTTQQILPPTHFDDSREAYEHWGRQLEAYVDKLAQAQACTLPHNWQGRAQRTTPENRREQAITCKPSREGELTLQHDLVGTAVRRWYTQARRLQSLVHSLRAGKDTANARTYRLETWSSVTRAKGFTPDFISWWQAREPHYPDSPVTFPQWIPSLSETQLIYEEFVSHFKAFERWHQHQRQQQLQAKYDRTNKRLFSDLRPPQANELDILWEEQHFEILAHEPETGQIHVSEEIEPDPAAIWLLDQVLTIPRGFDGVLCTLPTCTQVFDSSVLTRRIFFHTTDSIHQQLIAHWAPKWQAQAGPDDEKWQRVTAFVHRYMPQLSINLQPITADQWRRALKRMKPTSATGPDGISRTDLLNMPRQHAADWILQFLDRLENQQCDWPPQLLTGLITCIAKTDDAHTPSSFRPIHLFSLIYRLWGSIRTRELLRVLLPHLPEEAYGFVPGRETTQVWSLLQAWAETSLELTWSLTGLSTDVQKCFNCTERPQCRLLAEHLGVPKRITAPGNKYLDAFERRFQVRNTVGAPIRSSRGYAEGCPLSIIAMITINWAHHNYMKIYCPRVMVKSFVDNIDLICFSATDLMMGMACTISCLDMWGLTTDEAKTYSWSLDSNQRAALKAWKYRVALDAPELGGSLTFCRAIRNRELKARGDKLEDKWDRLKKSLAPQTSKLVALYLVFWPAALHGISACIVSDHYIHTLRKQAVQATKLRRAGTNLMLKLTLIGVPETDPGFYQVKTVVTTFCRVLRKSDELLYLWRLFMLNYCGRVVPGPFSKLLQVFALIGWHVAEPPLFHDHFGQQHSLWTIDQELLHLLLTDGWFQYVAGQTHHKTMKGLRGMNVHLTTLDHSKQAPLQRLRISAIQSGAFLTAEEHGRYDDSKSRECQLCHTLDDRAHWLECPRFKPQRVLCKIAEHEFQNDPPCLVHHLLVPRLDLESQYRIFQHQMDPGLHSFEQHTVVVGRQHLFTDGACCRQHPELPLASWAIVHAGTGQIIQARLLAGMRQTIDRAELSAIVGALSWALQMDQDATVWSDSQSCIACANQLMQNPDLNLPEVNRDLWLEFQTVMRERHHLATELRWIPGHLDDSLTEDDYEDWIAKWNSQADQAATEALNWIDPLYLGLRRRVLESYQTTELKLRKLIRFYGLIADHGQQLPGREQPMQQTSDLTELPGAISEQISPFWAPLLMEQASMGNHEFAVKAIATMLKWDEAPGHRSWRSDIEIIFALTSDATFEFPYSCTDGRTELRPLTNFFERPTLAKLLRIFDVVITDAFSCLGIDHLRCSGLTVDALRIFSRGKGVFLSFPPLLDSEVKRRIISFTSSWPIRFARDLARPIWLLIESAGTHTALLPPCLSVRKSSEIYMKENITKHATQSRSPSASGMLCPRCVPQRDCTSPPSRITKFSAMISACRKEGHLRVCLPCWTSLNHLSSTSSSNPHILRHEVCPWLSKLLEVMTWCFGTGIRLVQRMNECGSWSICFTVRRIISGKWNDVCLATLETKLAVVPQPMQL